jgi:hypothetical protein
MANLRNLRILQTKVNVETRQIWQLGIDDQNQYWTIVSSPVRLQEGRQAFVDEQIQNGFGAKKEDMCETCKSTKKNVRMNVVNYAAVESGAIPPSVFKPCGDTWHGDWP